MHLDFLNIYECDDLIREIEAKAEANEGIIPDPDMEALVLAQTTSISKLTKLVGYVNYLESLQDAAKVEVDRIYKQKVAAAARVESIKQWLLPYVQTHGPINLGLHRISIRKSEGVVVDENFNNLQYGETVETFKVDKKKIKESIHAGVEVAGAKLEQRLNVQIK
jgi:hypothetical protein